MTFSLRRILVLALLCILSLIITLALPRVNGFRFGPSRVLRPVSDVLTRQLSRACDAGSEGHVPREPCKYALDHQYHQENRQDRCDDRPDSFSHSVHLGQMRHRLSFTRASQPVECPPRNVRRRPRRE